MIAPVHQFLNLAGLFDAPFIERHPDHVPTDERDTDRNDKFEAKPSINNMKMAGPDFIFRRLADINRHPLMHHTPLPSCPRTQNRRLQTLPKYERQIAAWVNIPSFPARKNSRTFAQHGWEAEMPQAPPTHTPPRKQRLGVRKLRCARSLISELSES